MSGKGLVSWCSPASGSLADGSRRAGRLTEALRSLKAIFARLVDAPVLVGGVREARWGRGAAQQWVSYPAPLLSPSWWIRVPANFRQAFGLRAATGTKTLLQAVPVSPFARLLLGAAATTAVWPGGQPSQWPVKRPDDRALPTAALRLHSGKVPSAFLPGLLGERTQHRRDVWKTMSRNRSGRDSEGIRSTGWHQRRLGRGEEQGQKNAGTVTRRNARLRPKCLVPRRCLLESRCLLDVYHVQDAVPGPSLGTLIYAGWGTGTVRWRERPRPQERLRSKAASPTVHTQALIRSPHRNRVTSRTLAKLVRGFGRTSMQFI